MRTVSILHKSVNPGDVLTLTVSPSSTIQKAFTMKGLAEAKKVAVNIECFVEPPTPPELQPCQACGSFKVTSGEPFEIVVDKDLFSGKTTGILKLSFSDSSGWKHETEIAVDTGVAQAVESKRKQRQMEA